MKKFLLPLFFTYVLLSCKPTPVVYTEPIKLFESIPISIDSFFKNAKEQLQKQKIIRENELKVLQVEKPFLAAGLIDIKKIAPQIRVDLRYSSTNNFMNSDVYGAIENAYLQPDVAGKLALAQFYLDQEYPGFALLVYDAARPLSVQQLMWDIINIPVCEKTKYLSNPQQGSLHNYGAAVDLTITDSLEVELDMGTSYDYFGELAYPRKEAIMLAQGKLTNQQILNRQLLRKVMFKAGFFNIQTEWWHFNSCTLKKASTRYKLIQ